jgi:hypothetical protein
MKAEEDCTRKELEIHKQPYIEEWKIRKSLSEEGNNLLRNIARLELANSR